MLQFDPTTHIYTVAGRSVPGVTEIIKSAGLIDDRWYTDEAREFGQYGHQAMRLLLTDNLGSVDPRFDPWLAGMRRFVADQKPVARLIETPLADKSFAGTPDFCGTISQWKRPAVLDWKFWSTATPSMLRVAGVQVAGYSRLLTQNGYPCHHRAVVHFRENTYQVHEITEPSDIQIFRAALTLYHWRRK